LKTLGFGGTCKVKLGVNENTGQHVAIKIMKDDLEDDVIKYVRCEVEALQKL
jgi:serine/threonine protein kinase